MKRKTKRTKKVLTEREAWLFLDKRFMDFYHSGIPGHWSDGGICVAITRMCRYGKITKETKSVMDYKLCTYMDWAYAAGLLNCAYLHPRTSRDALKRAAVCRWFAHQIKP